MKIKSFECPKSIRNYEKKNSCYVRHLVDNSFVPSAQQTSVLYCKLSDLKSFDCNERWQGGRNCLMGMTPLCFACNIIIGDISKQEKQQK